MKGKIAALAMAGAFAAALLVTPAMAGKGGNGNGAPSGAHYNLNIIGVEKAKKADMTGSNRHVIFVPLKSTGSGKFSKPQYDPGTGELLPGTEIVDSIIWLTPGDDFQVCDGNGFDAAYDGCDSGFDEYIDAGSIFFDADGNPLGPLVGNERKQGAVFMLPCNTNITNDQDNIVTCDAGAEGHIDAYGVWARAVGNSGSATMTTCAFEDADGELVCSLENEVLMATKGKTEFRDVTDALTSLVVSECVGTIDANGICDDVETTRIALFSGSTHDWFWNYNNDGLRLAQLHFYEL
jgi:hypothetical protein